MSDEKPSVPAPPAAAVDKGAPGPQTVREFVKDRGISPAVEQWLCSVNKLKPESPIAEDAFDRALADLNTRRI